MIVDDANQYIRASFNWDVTVLKNFDLQTNPQLMRIKTVLNKKIKVLQLHNKNYPW